jgi:hypothetical protein
MKYTLSSALLLSGEIVNLKKELEKHDLEALKMEADRKVFEEKRKEIGKNLILKQLELNRCMDVILPLMKTGDL